MKQFLKSHRRSIAAAMGVLTMASLVSYNHTSTLSMDLNSGWLATVSSNRSFQRMQRKKYESQPNHRIAQRLQQRLRRRGSRAVPSINVLAKAVASRQALLRKHISVTFLTEEDEDHTVWDVSASRYPLWIRPSFTMKNAKFVINPDQIRQDFSDGNIITVDPPVHAILRSITFKENEKSVSRANIEGTARAGYLPDVDLIASSIAKAFHSDLTEMSIVLEKEEGRIINMTDLDLGNLRLWSTGKSNYRGSTYSRAHNVEKALNKHVQNTVVAPGDTYSFNSTLDGPVSIANGWRMAKIIVNGGDLELAPGGGICQASTTVFRAIVNGGFPVVDRRAHSIYVSYYKKHGVGIDATIYPGSQDLVFTNDTDNYLVIQSYSEGSDAFVNIFGTPDGRTVALEGPYFASTAPQGFTYRGRGIHRNEIVWIQRIDYPSGESREYQIGSRYKTLPESVAREFKVEETVFTSAPLAQLSN